jgi:hypothetical protein
LVSKLHLGGVATLTGPHATTVRPGPKALGPMLSHLITPCGVALSSDDPYRMVCRLLRRFALLWWRTFEFLTGACCSCMWKGRSPLAQISKALDSSVREPSGQRVRDALSLCPARWGPTRWGPFRAWQPRPLFGTQEAFKPCAALSLV